MADKYPQFEVGTTLVWSECGDERRRVYLRQRGPVVEVGEVTSGTCTQNVYGSPAHLHCLHLRDLGAVRHAREFFAEGEPYLVDYMDELDARGDAYGYMSTLVGQYVCYRPARGTRRMPCVG